MAINWIYGIKSVGFAKETAYGTENTTDGDFLWMPAEISVPALARKIEEIKAATGQPGAFEPPVVGSKHGTPFTLKFPLRTFKAGYAPGTDLISSAGTLAPEVLLFANALGSNSPALTNMAAMKAGAHLSVVAYAAGDVASYAAGPPSVVTATATDAKAGTFLLTSTDADDAAPLRAWVKSASGKSATLFEPPQNAASASDNIWQSATAWLSDLTQAPLTFRIMGNHTTQKLALIGCICVGWTLHGKSGEQPMVELSMVATDNNQYATGGAMWSYGAFNRLPPVLAGVGRYGRLTFGDTSSGGVAFDGLSDLTVKCDYTMAYPGSHNKAQGVLAAIVTDRKITVSGSVPFDSAGSFSGGLPIWDTAFENGTSKCLTVTVGYQPGSVFSFQLPAMHLAVQPALKEEAGLLYHALQFRPSKYDSEGTSGSVDATTTPADALFKFGVA